MLHIYPWGKKEIGHWIYWRSMAFLPKEYAYAMVMLPLTISNLTSVLKRGAILNSTTSEKNFVLSRSPADLQEVILQRTLNASAF
jgi:hypothetical protein